MCHRRKRVARMNDSTNPGDRWLIPATLLVALVFERLALPSTMSLFRPELLAMMVIYWSLTAPYRVGVTVAFSVGLLNDVLGGGLLGVGSIVLCMQAYISLMVFQQVRVLPRFQQALFVLVLLILGKILAATILGAIGRFPAASFWWSLPTSVVAWPFLCALLRRWRKKPLIHA